MATLFSRLYDQVGAARTLADSLIWDGVPRRDVRIVSRRADETVTELVARLQKMHVHESAATAYGPPLMEGAVVLVVRATYRPLGAPKLVRATLAKSSVRRFPDAIEEHRVKEPPQIRDSLSILPAHPKLFSLGMEDAARAGPVTADLGFRMLTDGPRKTSVIEGGRRMVPLPLLRRRRARPSVLAGGTHISRRFWPMPLVTRKERTSSVIRGPGTVFSRSLGMSTVIR